MHAGLGVHGPHKSMFDSFCLMFWLLISPKHDGVYIFTEITQPSCTYPLSKIKMNKETSEAYTLAPIKWGQEAKNRKASEWSLEKYESRSNVGTYGEKIVYGS